MAFTSDPRRISPDFWMLDYFGELYAQACEVFPSEQTLTQQLFATGFVEVILCPFPLPHDVQDGFFCSAWRRPEDYLDSTFRDGISSFRLMDPDRLRRAIERLRTDLASAAWHAKFGNILARETYGAGYIFATAMKPYERDPNPSSAIEVSAYCRAQSFDRLHDAFGRSHWCFDPMSGCE